MAESELKPCPFCGKAAQIEKENLYGKRNFGLQSDVQQANVRDTQKTRMNMIQKIKPLRHGTGGLTMTKHEEGFKSTAELHSYLISKNRRLQEYLNSLPMSLVDMIKSGKLRPPEEISMCQFCFRPCKNEQEGCDDGKR